MPRAFAGSPTYSFSIVAQTGSAIGGYKVENLGGGGVPCAILNDSRQVVFSADGNDGSYWIGYLTERVLLATSAQFGYPNKALSFFLNNAGEVYIDMYTGIYAVPVNASAPPSLLFEYSLMPGVPYPHPTYGNPRTWAFGVDDAGGVGLVQSWQRYDNKYLGTQNGVQFDVAQLPHTYGGGGFQEYPVMSRSGQVAFTYVGKSGNSWLGTTGGLVVGPGSVLGGVTIAYLEGPLGISDGGQVAFMAAYASRVGIFTNNGLAIAVVPGWAADVCNPGRVNINDNGLIAYTGLAEFPSPYGLTTYIGTQYGYVAKPGDTILGKTLAGAYNNSNYFLNNNNDLVFWVEFTDGTQAIVLATDTDEIARKNPQRGQHERQPQDDTGH